MSTTFWEELAKVKNHRRRAYFQWKNDVQNLKIDYGAMSEDEFIELCNKPNRHTTPITDPEYFFNNMKRWESSPEYKRLLFLLKEDEFATDLLEVYDAVKEKAINDTDSQAIKNMVMLQKEIKKYRKSIDKFQEQEEKVEEDDGLII